MPARCFVDNCHIAWSEVVDEYGGPAYRADVRHDASLHCVQETGLGVDIVEDASNLVTSTQGQALLVQLPVSTVVRAYENAANDSSAVQVNSQVADAVSTSGTRQNSPYPHHWVNDTGRPALVVFSGTFNLDYAVLGPGSQEDGPDLIRVGGVTYPAVAGTSDAGRLVVPFNAQWHARLRWGIDDGNAPNTSVQPKFVTGGMLSTFKGNQVYQVQTERIPFADVFRVDAGQTLTMRADIAHAGPDQTINVVARGSGALADLGFGLRDMKFTIIPTR